MPSRAEVRVPLRGPGRGMPPVVAAGGASRPTSRTRQRVEWALRVAAMVLLALALLDALRPAPARSPARAERDVDAALARWTARPPGAAWVSLDTLPSPVTRDWLRALRRAGTPVGWGGDSLPSLAVEASAVPDPAGGTRVRVASRRGSRVAVGDAAGVLDTLRVGGAGAVVELGATTGRLRAGTSRGSALGAVPDSLRLGRLLVAGRAGWEAKFALAALEERGWTVDARLRVAPGMDVRSGAPSAPDTARYAAVVLLDTTAADLVERAVRFARSGGGLVLAGDAARVASAAAVAPGAVGARVPGVAGAVAGDAPRTGLGVWPVVRLRGDAIPLERRGALVTVAARRAGLGRVVQVGYDESWRWRMSGGDGAEAAHRAWWSRLVSGVARARPAAARDSSGIADPAPRAALAGALGPASPPPAGGDGDSRGPWRVATFLGIMVLLLAEWGSRRARGAR